MSTELQTVRSSDGNHAIHNASFSGGERGQMLQIGQMRRSNTGSQIQLTREQVIEQIAVMAAWLGEH